MSQATELSPPSTALTVQQRALAAIATGIEKTRDELEALAKKHADITAITGVDGRADCHSAYMEIKNVRVAIEKAAKDARDDATKFSKAVIEEEKKLVAIVATEEERLKKIRDAWDAEQEAIRQAEAQKEAMRVARHQAVIDGWRGLPTSAAGKDPAALQVLIEQLDASETAGLEEFRAEAEGVRAAARAALTGMLAGAIKAEQDAKELELLRAKEADRQAKEQAERLAQEEADRRAAAELKKKAAEEEARIAAMRKAEEDRLARERAEHDARLAADQKAAAEEIANRRAEQERVEREAAEARTAEEARQRQAREAIVAEAARQREAEAARQRELAAIDSKVARAAPAMYQALKRLAKMLPPGTPEGDVVETVLREAGLE